MSSHRSISSPVADSSPRRVVTGSDAVYQVELTLSDILYLQSGGTALTIGQAQDSGDGPRADIRMAERASDLSGSMLGAALTGLRAAGFTHTNELSRSAESLMSAVWQRAPMVIHHTCEASHTPYTMLADSGAFQMFASDVQEAVDLGIIARRITELSLTPGVCAMERHTTAEALHTIYMPRPDVIRQFAGSPGDLIEPPTPSQHILYGQTRRLVPDTFSLNRPLGLGARLGEDADLQASAAQQAFYSDHVAQLIDRSMAAYEEHTGRRYARASGYRIKDAEYIVMAQGAIVPQLKEVVDFLRDNRGIRAGLVNLSVYRPFPSDVLLEMLRGTSAVTTIEYCPERSANLRPIHRDVRVMLDQAVEAGRTDQEECSRPGSPSLARSEKPLVYSGTYAGGTSRPTFSDLCSVYYNMMQNGTNRTDFSIGARFEIKEPRLPALERMQQVVRRAYPSLARRVLSTESDPARENVWLHAFQLQTAAEWDGLSAARLLAKSLFELSGWDVRALKQPAEGDHAPHIVDLFYRAEMDQPAAITGAESLLNSLVLSHTGLLDTPDILDNMRDGGHLLIAGEQSPSEIWARFPRHIQQALKELSVTICTVDADAIGKDSTEDFRFQNAARSQALVGGFISLFSGFTDDEKDQLAATYSRFVTDALSGPASLAQALDRAVDQGYSGVRSVHSSKLNISEQVATEPAPPWPLKGIQDASEGIDDASRFWRSVGFLHESGKRDEMLADPFIASGAMPARTSAAHNMSALESTAPSLIAERCTGCGLCWSLCPDSALPATVQGIDALAQGAIDQAESAGHDVFALKRVLPHIVKQARRLAVEDDLDRFTRLGDLLNESYVRIADKLGLDDEKRRIMDESFEHVRSGVDEYPIVRTESFDGQNGLLSISVDLTACKSCGICAERCPEDALEMTYQTAELVDTYSANLDFQRSLPDVPLETIESLLQPDKPETELYRLLNRNVYNTRVGGDNGAPGDSVRTALHLVLSAAEATMQPRLASFTDELRSLRTELGEAMQRQLTDAVEVNDLDALARRLTEKSEPSAKTDQYEFSLDAIEDLLVDDGSPHTIDRDRITNLARSRSEIDDILRVYESAAQGDGRARMAVSFGASDRSGARVYFPYNPFPFPWIHHLPDSSPAVAEGLFEGIRSATIDTVRSVRKARLLSERTYTPDEHDDMLRTLSWNDLTAQEAGLVAPVIAVIDRSDAQIDRLLESDLPVKIVHLAADRYGNDTLYGNLGARNEPALQALMHGGAFVSQTSTGYPEHVIRDVMEALAFSGPAFVSIHACSPARHAVQPDQAGAQAKRAVDSRTSPLFSYNPEIKGDFCDRIRLQHNPNPDNDWGVQTATLVSAIGRRVEAEWPLTFADWAVREGRFHAFFRHAPRKDWHDNMLPIASYINLDREDRTQRDPYVQIADEDGHASRWIPLDPVIRETEYRLQVWNLLRELAGLQSQLADRYAAQAQSEIETRVAEIEQSLESSYQEKLASRLDEKEQSHARRYHSKLKRQLLTLSGMAAEGAEAKSVLRDYLDSGYSDADNTGNGTGGDQPESNDSTGDLNKENGSSRPGGESC